MVGNRKKLDAIELLGRQIDRVESFRRSARFSSDFVKWKRDTEIAIGQVFGQDSGHLMDFRGVKYSSSFSYRSHDEYETKSNDQFQQGLSDACAILASMRDEIQDYWRDDMRAVPSAGIARGGACPVKPVTREVFIVHGHDHGLKDTVARFLEKLELKPIILHEQPNRGRTIIEKFQDHASVPFAVALFTGDDLGGIASDVKALDDLKPRARQNVVFEFGYFVGSIPQGHCVALVERGVELPSDWAGVLYIQVDETGAGKSSWSRN